MTLTELLPSLQELTKDEKLLAIEFLNKELVKEENLFTQKQYHIHTLFGMEEAALKVMELLKQHNNNG